MCTIKYVFFLSFVRSLFFDVNKKNLFVKCAFFSIFFSSPMLILGKNIDQSDSSVSEEEEEELEGEETEELDRVIEQPSKSLPKSVDKNIEESYPIYHDYMSSIEESELESRFKKFLEKHQGSSSSAATASASATTPPIEESSSSSKKALKKKRSVSSSSSSSATSSSSVSSEEQEAEDSDHVKMDAKESGSKKKHRRRSSKKTSSSRKSKSPSSKKRRAVNAAHKRALVQANKSLGALQKRLSKALEK